MPFATPLRQPQELLSIDRLEVAFDGGPPAVRGVTLSVCRGEIYGLVGESGSGKTLTALAVAGLLPEGAALVGGRIVLAGVGDLAGLGPAAWRSVRGARVGMVFQEPASALNPVLTIGFQIAEALRAHRSLSRRDARRGAREWLERVAMPDPEGRLDSYPHELSGGQQQRALIAMALAGRPELVLADEPTTALDVTVQAQILELLLRLRDELDLTVILITHDLGVVAACCDRVAVMHAGVIVEEAEVEHLFAAPRHPHTRELLASVRRPAGRESVA